MTKNHCYSNRLKFLLVILLIIGIFFRFINLNEKVYWKDEVFTSLRTSGYTEKEVQEQIYDSHVLSIQNLQKYQHPNQEKSAIDTIKGLALEESQLPPLYFVLVRFWVQLFGSSVAVTRSLSAIFSLLALVCLYFLCQELFKSSLVGWIAVALLSVSPFQVLYAQTARHYSLWMLTSLLSSWMLLRALRVKTKLSWGIYAATIILGLYTSPFSLFVVIGQGIYLFIIERFQVNKIVKSYLFSFVASIIAFAPWIVITLFRLHQVKGRTDWSSNSYEHGILELFFNLFRNLTRLFLDFDNLNNNFEYLYQKPFFYLIAIIPIVVLAGYSFVFLCRHAPKQSWLFILTFIGATALPLVLPDLILGGRRSGTARYLLPSYLGVQIVVAYFLAAQIASTSINSWKQKIWQIVTLLIFSLGIFSCANISTKTVWWNNDPSRYIQNSEIALLINQAKKPLVISDFIWDRIFTLSYSLEPKVQFLLIKQKKIPEIPDGFSDYFLYQPSEMLTEKLEQKYNYAIKSVYQSNDPWLWRLEKNLIINFLNR